MLTTETKQRINTCRDILVGKLPDPKSQVLQITNALIYKFMDDQDRLAEKLGGSASFFVKDLKPYAWHKLFDTKLNNQQKADKYIEGVQKLSEAKHLPELFQEIFKEAYVPFRAAGTITLFIDEINKFDYTHSEELGNAYEYLLNIMGTQADAGQFRTPRHVIEFIVDVVNPQKDETIYDPASGTAGFLIAAYNHIAEANPKLSATEKRAIGKNISGVDISPDMAKMARVNLYLHGFTTPNILEGDTLSDENLWGKKRDVILANPPFMSPKGGIIPHDKFGVKAKRSEVLFVDYIAEHLKLKGRAGIIVPEGIIFQSGTAYKELRKMLVEDGYLYVVVSLPAGVFQPYSGVKTSVLILDREKAKEAEDVLFIKIENDGFSQSTQRTVRDGSQLPEALAVARAWREGKKQESPIASWVSKKEIAESGEYNLSGDRYRIFETSSSSWPMTKLRDHLEVFSGFAFDSKKFNEQEGTPLVRIRNIKTNKTDTLYRGVYEDKYIVEDGDLLVGMDGEFNAVIWGGGRALLNQRVCRLESFDGILKEYVYYLMQDQLQKIEEATYAVTVKHISSKQIKEIEIPLPPLSVQKEIVAELDRYQKIIDGARQVVQNYKPSFKIDPAWPLKKIPEIAFFQEGPGIRSYEYQDRGYPIINVRCVQDGYLDLSDSKAVKPELAEDKWKHFQVSEGDILFTTSGTIGRVAVVQNDHLPLLMNTSVVRFHSLDEAILSNAYLYQYLRSAHFVDPLKAMSTGSAQQNVGPSHIKTFSIPIPPLEMQQQITSELAREQQNINASSELARTFEQKIQDKISEVWGE